MSKHTVLHAKVVSAGTNIILLRPSPKLSLSAQQAGICPIAESSSLLFQLTFLALLPLWYMTQGTFPDANFRRLSALSSIDRVANMPCTRVRHRLYA